MFQHARGILQVVTCRSLPTGCKIPTTSIIYTSFVRTNQYSFVDMAAQHNTPADTASQQTVEENGRDTSPNVEKLLELLFRSHPDRQKLANNVYLFRCDSQSISKLKEYVDEYRKK